MAPALKRLLKAPAIGAAALFGPHRQTLLPGTDDRLWVLMYHRVLPADDPRHAAEEPGMVVTPATLQLHLRLLKRFFTVMTLEEWLTRRTKQQSLPKRACAITFDDGWLDNYEYAAPILAAEGVPATIFAVSEMLGTARRFWPNRLADLTARLDEPGVQDAMAWLQPLTTVTAPPDQEQLAKLILRCKERSDAWLTAQLDRAEAAVGSTSPAKPPLMSYEQLRELVADGIFNVGSHTCNHFRLLPALEDAVLEREIVASKRQLEEQLGRPVNLFCYPNGDADPRATRLVKEHYLGAVTTRRGINTSAASSVELARIGLHDDGSRSSLEFQARLSAWL